MLEMYGLSSIEEQREKGMAPDGRNRGGASEREGRVLCFMLHASRASWLQEEDKGKGRAEPAVIERERSSDWTGTGAGAELGGEKFAARPENVGTGQSELGTG